MQWDKVKNILLVILLLVDGFLGWSIASRYFDARAQEKAFAANLSTVLARSGVTYSAELTMPTQHRIMPLEVDRSRAAEEQMARAVLTGEIRTEVAETGALSFAGDNGTVVWQADGAVRAVVQSGEAPPTTAGQMTSRAKELLQACGVSLRGGTLSCDAANSTVTLTATVANLPVWNRKLAVSFGAAGATTITGMWFFETPYASTSDQERVYNVADALLSFVAEHPETRRIDGIALGYTLHMPLGASGRLQLVPTWQIETDRGQQYMDAIK